MCCLQKQSTLVCDKLRCKGAAVLLPMEAVLLSARLCCLAYLSLPRKLGIYNPLITLLHLLRPDLLDASDVSVSIPVCLSMPLCVCLYPCVRKCICP